MNKLVVIARYKENLDWVENLKHDFLIYNKGEDWPYKYNKEDVKNFGREPETYLRAIIENYELLENYKFMVFLQGDPNAHCNDLIEKIDLYEDEEKYGFLCNSTGSFEFEEILYVDGFSINMIDCLLNGSYIESSGAMKTLYLINLFGIRISKCAWGYSCGAQYVVPMYMILKKPKEWWIKVYEVYHYYCQYEHHDPSHMMEFLWPVLWIHGT